MKNAAKFVIVSCIVFFRAFPVFAQDNVTVTVEKLLVIRNFTRVPGRAGAPDGPNLLFVDEEGREIEIPSGARNGGILVKYNPDGHWETFPAASPPTDGGTAFRLGPFRIEASYSALSIVREDMSIIRLDSGDMAGGLSFVLKNREDENYTLFFVNSAGEARAADTRGRVFRKEEAVERLRSLGGNAFGKSLERARELGLERKFLNGEALVWEQNYYAPPAMLNAFWKRIIYPLTDEPVQYDTRGNGYQLYRRVTEREAEVSVWTADSNGRRGKTINITPYSDILKNYPSGGEFTAAFRAGSDGVIYCVIAGDEYSELFRIR